MGQMPVPTCSVLWTDVPGYKPGPGISVSPPASLPPSVSLPWPQEGQASPLLSPCQSFHAPHTDSGS